MPCSTNSLITTCNINRKVYLHIIHIEITKMKLETVSLCFAKSVICLRRCSACGCYVGRCFVAIQSMIKIEEGVLTRFRF